MNVNYKLTFIATIMFTLFGCGSTRMDMTTSKVSSTSPSIYSATFHFFESEGMLNTKTLRGTVVKINNKNTLTNLSFKRVFLDPGVHSIEMTWLASFPPVTSKSDEVSTSNQPLGYAPISVNKFIPKRKFTMQLKVRNGYDYFVNLQDSIIKNRSYHLPKRLCISEVKKNSKLIKVAPGGNIFLKKPVKILACSS